MRFEQLDIDEKQFEDLIEPLSVFKTDLYEIQISRAGEIRFGPEYKYIKIFSKGVEIWDGGNNIYGEESFSHNVFGDKYDKLILVKWFSTNNPYEQTVVEINLATGRETNLDLKQRYWAAGHFYSFDGMFYRKSDIRDFLCKDFQAKSDFLLFERINEKVTGGFEWAISSVDDCIIVYSRNKTDNVVLYNIRRKEIVDNITIDFDLSRNGGIISRLDKKNNQLIIRSHDYDLADDNRIINARNKYFKIDLKD